MKTDGPFTVWVVDTCEIRTRIKTYESLKRAEAKANRIFQTLEAEMQFGHGVDITDGREETISSQLVQ
jgi:hypothetical protein